MTERLYYKDPELLTFSSEITECGRDADRYYTVLKESAFYPTSGGQQFDTGKINEVPIVDVVELEDGTVRHLSDRPIGKVGETVQGLVDRARRMRHRRQHTAQHILSQAFIKTSGAETVSVHLGEEYGAVELNSDNLSDSQLNDAEEFSNEIVGQSLPIEIMFVQGDQIDRLPLRKIPDRSGTLRVIRISELDYSACGGTHCKNTSEVLCVKLAGVEKIRGRLLVRFLSGEQALDDYAMRYRVTSQLSQTMTCHVNDLPGKFEKLAEENKELRKELADLQKQLLPIRAEELAGLARPTGTTKLVVADIGSFDPKAIGQLAGMVAARIEGVVLLFSEGRLVLAAAEPSGCDAGAIARGLAADYQLKGGGNPRQAQLGGAKLELLPAYAETMIGSISHD